MSADQDYEVRQLVEKHSLSEQQARDLIACIGNDCKKLDQARRTQILKAALKERATLLRPTSNAPLR